MSGTCSSPSPRRHPIPQHCPTPRSQRAPRRTNQAASSRMNEEDTTSIPASATYRRLHSPPQARLERNGIHHHLGLLAVRCKSDAQCRRASTNLYGLGVIPVRGRDCRTKFAALHCTRPVLRHTRSVRVTIAASIVELRTSIPNPE